AIAATMTLCSFCARIPTWARTTFALHNDNDVWPPRHGWSQHRARALPNTHDVDPREPPGRTASADRSHSRQGETCIARPRPAERPRPDATRQHRGFALPTAT